VGALGLEGEISLSDQQCAEDMQLKGFPAPATLGHGNVTRGSRSNRMEKRH